MSGCISCCYKMFPRIPAAAPKKTSIALVGEAPTIQEITNKQHMSGPVGQLLDKTMKAVGLPLRGEVFLTCAILCRPPVGKPLNKGGIDCCRERVLAELKAAQPKIVIVLGNVALQSVTGQSSLKITQVQGQIIEKHLLGEDVTVIASFHPAAILREGSRYKAFYNGFKLAKDLLDEKPQIEIPMPTFSIVDTKERAEKAVAGLKKIPYLACDIETGRRVGPGKRILAVGICWAPGKVLIFPDEMHNELQPLFKSKETLFIWHNGKFDTQMLNHLGHEARIDEDTMLLDYCLDETPGTHDLEQVGIREVGITPYKGRLNDYTANKETLGYEEVPREVLYPYLAQDCDTTLRVFHKHRPRIEANPHLEKLYTKLLIPAAAFLRGVESRGILVNKEAVLVERERLTSEIEVKVSEIGEIAAPIWDPLWYATQTGAKTAPAVYNPRSPKQTAWLIFDRMGLRVKGMKGRSTNAETLLKLQGKSPIIDQIINLRSLNTSLSKYVDGPDERKDCFGRVHATFNLHASVTGRLSCVDPNLQNVPPSYRWIYKAPPGKTFVEADYKGAELRVLASISGDKFLSEVFRDGRDLHDEVAIAFFGDNFTRDDRMKAKTINFGIPYGRTPYSISQDFGIPFEEAQRLVNAWMDRAPEAAIYLRDCDKSVLEGRVLITPLGRMRRFGLISESNYEGCQNEARNFRIQSISSDMTLLSGMEMEEPLKEVHGQTLNLVHDSILNEVDDDPESIRKTLILMRDTMAAVPKKYLNTDIPFEVDFKVGPVWGQMVKVKDFKDYGIYD